MRHIQKIQALFLTVSVLSLMSCKKDDPSPEDTINNNPQEVITKVRLEFTNQADPNDIPVAEWSDPDGDGGNPPVIDNIQLQANSVYDLNVRFFTTGDVEITSEILEEGTSHQIFHNTTGDAISTFDQADMDTNGDPIGLEVTVNTGIPSNSDYILTLKHQPGIKDGNIMTGTTDVEATFPVSSI